MSELAQIAGLLPSFQDYWGGSQIAIQKTNPNDSDKSTADTIALMGNHARTASSSQQIKEALAKAGCIGEGLTEDEVISRVFRFIKGSVIFVEDESQLENIFQNPKSKELLITPPALLSMAVPKGDCDDFSMLACSMLMAKGIQCDFVTVAANGSSPWEYSHVYCLARTRDGRAIPFDASHGKEAGWETGRVWRKQVWPVFVGSRIGRGGMGMVISKHQSTPNSGTRGLGFLYEKQFNIGLGKLLRGLGDCSYDDEGNLIGCDTPLPAPTGGGTDINLESSIPPNLTTTPVSSTGGVNWNSILSSITGAASKIAVQTTQQPGVQSQTCNAAGVCTSTSTVLPAGYSGSLSIPGLTSSSISGLIPLLLIGAVVIFAMEK